MKKQKELDARGLFVLDTVDPEQQHREVVVPPEEPDEMDGAVSRDNNTGEHVDSRKVMAARREELDYYRSMDAYKIVSKEEAWAVTGKAPIGVRWLDVNKGGSSTPRFDRGSWRRTLNEATIPSCMQVLHPWSA